MLNGGTENTESPYVTKSGKVLTDADIQALADEAERGYPIEQIDPTQTVAVGARRVWRAPAQPSRPDDRAAD